MPDTVLKWPAELGPALRVGFSFKLHSQFIVEKKKILSLGSVDSCLVPRWHSLGIAPFTALPQRHAISCSCWSLWLHFSLYPWLPSSPPSPGPRISIKTWSAVAGRRKKAQPESRL